jgi:hypothetical protein
MDISYDLRHTFEALREGRFRGVLDVFIRFSIILSLSLVAKIGFALKLVLVVSVYFFSSSLSKRLLSSGYMWIDS